MNNKKFSKSLLGLAVALCCNSVLAVDAYRVIEISADAEYKHAVATGLNNNAEIVGNASLRFDVGIYQEEYLRRLTENGIRFVPDEEYEANEYSTTTLTLLRDRLVLGGSQFFSSPRFQKISDRSGFAVNLNGATDNQANAVNLVDVVDAGQSELTGSSESRIEAINDSSMMVGYASAPYLLAGTFVETLSDLDSDDAEATVEVENKYWNRAYTSRATVTLDGVTTVIEPEFSTYGGRTAAYDISNNGYVAGAQSIAFTNGDDSETAIQAFCPETVAWVDDLAVCSMWYQATATTYLDTAVIWQVDGTGNVVNTMSFPFDFEVPTDSTAVYSSRVNAVNNNGEGAGYGIVPRESNEAFTTKRAMYFADGVTTRVPLEHGDFDTSDAFDVNDNGLVVGTLTRVADGTQFYIYNSETGEVEFPTTFFASSQSDVAAINNSGVVVGSAEYEITLADTKRRHAFVYDTVTDQFRDLNNVIACDNSLEIVAASDINDNGQILASAIEQVDARNNKGEVVYQRVLVSAEYDADGNIIPGTEVIEDLLDENGEKVTVKETVVKTVLLDPIDSVSENPCGEEESIKRKGFSLGWISAVLLSGLVGIRRRFL